MLVGLGRIASTLEKDPLRIKPCTHAGVLFSEWGQKNFALEGIFDTNPEKVSLFQNQWNLNEDSILISPEKFNSIGSQRKGNRHPGFDFCIIATPSATHFTIAANLIRAGIPNLLIEKPVSLTSEDAKKLKTLADRQNAKIWINHERRYHPKYQFIKRIIESKNYGKVELVRANVLTSAKNPGMAFSKTGGGPLIHDGTHALDLMFWMFGKLKIRYANVIRQKPKFIEDRATAWLTSRNGIEVFLDVAGGRDYFQFEIDIFTTKGRFILSNDGFHFYLSNPSSLYKGFKSLEPTTFSGFSDLEKSSAFLGIYQEIESNIRQKSDYQEGTIKDNIDILECIESIYQFRRK